MFTVVTPPSGEPLSLDEAKAHLVVDIDDDDALIGSLITVAREKCESYLSRSFLTTAYKRTYAGFPGQRSRYGTGSMGLGSAFASMYGYVPERFLVASGQPFNVPWARLISVTSITYLDLTGTRQTLDPSAYDYEPGDGGLIVPAYGTTWPSARVHLSSVQLNLTYGYGPDPADVPEVIKQGMRLMIGHMYNNREAVTDFNTFELTMGVKWVLAAEDWGVRV